MKTLIRYWNQDPQLLDFPPSFAKLGILISNELIKTGRPVSVKTCECRTPGQDDGDMTCWMHHDCSTQECTHQEEDYDE